MAGRYLQKLEGEVHLLLQPTIPLPVMCDGYLWPNQNGYGLMAGLA